MLPFERIVDQAVLGGHPRAMIERPAKRLNAMGADGRAFSGQSALIVEIYALAEAAALEAEWADLALRLLEPNIFYGPGFALSAARHLGGGGGPRFAFVFEDGGTDGGLPTQRRLVGVFPFTVSKLDRAASILRGWSHAQSPLGTPLIDERRGSEALNAFFDAMAARGTHLILFPKIPLAGRFARVLRQVVAMRQGVVDILSPGERAVFRNGQASGLDLVRHQRTKKLKELRRQRNRLGEFGPLNWRIAVKPGEVCKATERFLALEAAGWKGAKGTAFLRDPGRLTFLRAMARSLARSGQIEIEELFAGESLVACGILLKADAKTRYFWKITYDEGFARLSPGVLFTQELTSLALDNPELEMIDSCAISDHPMINHLWHERLSIGDLLVASAPGHGLGLLLAGGRERARCYLRQHAGAILRSLTGSRRS
jgi:hypothetical protein